MRTRIAFLAMLLWLCAVVTIEAQSLPSAKPEQVGLSSERLKMIMTTLKADTVTPMIRDTRAPYTTRL